MEILHYTEEHKQFRKRLRKFCQSEIIPNVQKWENDGIVPKSVWKKMGQAGFLCTAISPDYGGRGGDFLYSVIALEEVTRTNHYGLDAFLHSVSLYPTLTRSAPRNRRKSIFPAVHPVILLQRLP